MHAELLAPSLDFLLGNHEDRRAAQLVQEGGGGVEKVARDGLVVDDLGAIEEEQVVAPVALRAVDGVRDVLGGQQAAVLELAGWK